MSGSTERGWLDDPTAVAPTVLVIGGFLSSPPLFGPFRRRLLERGVADVVVAPVWLPDWLLAAFRPERVEIVEER